MENNNVVCVFPSRDSWGRIYAKYRGQIVSRLSSWYSLADREDAVENAFDKLMNKKDPESYGDRMPASPEDWAKVLYWHARSFLSHMKEHSEIHAKYVERISKELEGSFACVDYGAFLDAAVDSRALASALDAFRKDLDISRRNFEVYVGVVMDKIPAKDLAKKFKISENNVHAIKFRVGKLLAKYGKSYFRAALKKAA